MLLVGKYWQVAVDRVVWKVTVPQDTKFHRVQSSLPRQVSIDVAWAPGGVDGRHYSYTSLARMVDLVFVMGYDEQSQMWEDGPCVARPNSPLRKTFQGVSGRTYWVQGTLDTW